MKLKLFAKVNFLNIFFFSLWLFSNIFLKQKLAEHWPFPRYDDLLYRHHYDGERVNKIFEKK